MTDPVPQPDLKPPMCWVCLGTGRVLDLVPVGKRRYEAGPDHGKPCPCGCEDLGAFGA